VLSGDRKSPAFGVLVSCPHKACPRKAGPRKADRTASASGPPQADGPFPTNKPVPHCGRAKRNNDATKKNFAAIQKRLSACTFSLSPKEIVDYEVGSRHKSNPVKRMPKFVIDHLRIRDIIPSLLVAECVSCRRDECGETGRQGGTRGTFFRGGIYNWGGCASGGSDGSRLYCAGLRLCCRRPSFPHCGGGDRL